MNGVFDNLTTMRREWWSHGQIVTSISAERIRSADVHTSKSWGSYPDLPKVKHEDHIHAR